MIQIQSIRIAKNGFRATFTEKITVDTTEQLEAVREQLKLKYQVEFVDMRYRIINK